MLISKNTENKQVLNLLIEVNKMRTHIGVFNTFLPEKVRNPHNKFTKEVLSLEEKNSHLSS